MKRSQLVQLLVRFSVVYAVLLVICVRFPVYQYVELGAVAVVDLTLRWVGGPEEHRSLELLNQRGSWTYEYRLERPGKKPRTERSPFHAHPFVLVVFIALVLGTPGLGWQRAAIALGIGGTLVFGIGIAMLMADVQAWEPGKSGPYPAFVDWGNGLHHTAAGGLLPLMLWGFFIGGPLAAGFSRPAKAVPA